VLFSLEQHLGEVVIVAERLQDFPPNADRSSSA
jgi:hypothetical protein